MGVDAFTVALEPRKESNPGRHVHTGHCRLHNEEQNVFCIKCKRPICINCLTTTHKGHLTACLTEFVRIRRKTLHSTVKELKERSIELNTTSAYLKQEGDMLTANKEKDVANAKTQGKQMKDMTAVLIEESLTRTEKEYMEIQHILKEKCEPNKRRTKSCRIMLMSWNLL